MGALANRPEATSPPTRPAVRWLAFALMGTVALALAEISARVVFPLPEVVNFNRINYSGSGESPDGGNRGALMHYAFVWSSAPDGVSFVHHLNLYGFRDRDWNLGAGPAKRVAFVGDSFVEGFMAEDNATLPADFERIALQAGMELQTFNLGVGATGFPEYAQIIRDAVPVLRPTDVILVTYANDYMEVPAFGAALLDPPLSPRYRRTWVPRLWQVANRLAQGAPVPTRWHADPVPFFRPAPDPSNPWTRNDAYLSTRVDADIAKSMRAGTFNPYVVDELQEYEARLQKPVAIAEYISAIARFLRAREIAFHVVYLPYPAQVSDRYIPAKHRFTGDRAIASLLDPKYNIQAGTLAAAAAAVEVPFLDLTPALREADHGVSPLYWNYDLHMQAAGYALAAKEIFHWWRTSTETKAAPR